MNNNIKRGLAAVGALAVSGASHAAAGDVDVSPITAAAGQVALVGAAGFALFLGVKLWKWVRRAV